MKYWCECFNNEEEAGFDTIALAIVHIKIDCNGNYIPQSDWDFEVDVFDNQRFDVVTCSSCGELVEKRSQ